MQAEVTIDILKVLVEKRHVMYVPRSSRSLKEEYPDLKDYPAFNELTAQELRFVWFMRNDTSPYRDLEDEHKLDACVDAAFINEQQREARRIEYGTLKFPQKIRVAFEQMERFNYTSRVENLLHILKLRENCKMIIDEDMNGKSDDWKDDYMTRAAKAHKILMETGAALEGGALGITEDDGRMKGHEALASRLRQHHENRK